ncbi:Homocysteine-responsive endoplasmic reticulum-resident ubiquitin-like domain member 2 protein [Papilio xuthus]|uniref:Homocysteine-responsive endoplasmic reticulum-resident ubiquitin-like domain member 2 protein n=1 Tax=Papilio xuthus TaxID=66420 RepID=A0A194PZ68_PAPXU|nr:Homocysteine-responsive endoplasmic reticulum-resident ubiquitin-like domain member 2 protein [Papilio xuthus]
MLSDNVTLIVKAPNQQIEDQNIECQTSWTVKQLKGHLSEVYPSKPKTDEQKIIYSGQLLDDNTILKDVLRSYDSGIVHTMHLVCKPSRNMTKEKTEKTTETAPTAPPTEGRQTETTSRPETRQNDQNHNVEMQNYRNSFVNNYGRVPPYPNYNFGEGYLQGPNDAAMFANHMMMVQQAYLQYMQQYANMHRVATEQGEVPGAGVAGPVGGVAGGAEARPAQEADAAAGGAGEEAPRDWLDQVYVASRIAILLSLVCVYGSPARLLLVLLLAVTAYLHQIGFFRVLNVQQNNANANAPNTNTQTPTEETEPDPQQQSLLASTWIIITSFFASLMPETI